MRTRWALPLIVAWVGVCCPEVLAAPPTSHQPPAPYAPPPLKSPKLSLAEAIRLTLEHEPNLLLAREDVGLAGARVQQSRGAFDLTLEGSLSYEFTQNELGAAARQQQLKKRDDLRKEIERAEARAAQYDQLIQQLLAARGDLAAGNVPSGVNFFDPTVQAQWDTLLALYRNASPEQQEQIRRDIIAWLDSRVGELTLRRDEERATAIADRGELRDLGPIADVEQTQRGTVDLKLSKYYRTGLALTPFISLTGDAYRYQGKPRDERYGGPGGNDTYTSAIGFSVTVPFGRFRGVESAGAAEQASLIDWEASAKTLGFVASQSVLRTALAYFELAAAQRTLEVHRRSAELQARLAELTGALVEADELPRVELARMQARQAEVAALVERARVDLARARARLATATGVEVVDEGQALEAVDPLPQPPPRERLASLSSATLGDAAVERRLDIAAARSLERSGKVLWRAAAIDLAAVRDLEVKVSYAGLADEGGSVHHNVSRALFGNWTGPSGRLGYTFEKPFANNAQLGSLAQRAAALRQRMIAAAELERSVRLDVVQTTATLRQAVAQLEAARTAAASYRQAVENEMEKLRYARATLIDAILTEQRAVEAELAVVAAERSVAELLVKLRFDTGTLVETVGEGDFRVVGDPLALPAIEPR